MSRIGKSIETETGEVVPPGLGEPREDGKWLHMVTGCLVGVRPHSQIHDSDGCITLWISWQPYFSSWPFFQWLFQHGLTMSEAPAFLFYSWSCLYQLSFVFLFCGGSWSRFAKSLFGTDLWWLASVKNPEPQELECPGLIIANHSAFLFFPFSKNLFDYTGLSCDMWDLVPWLPGQTRAPCIGSTES